MLIKGQIILEMHCILDHHEGIVSWCSNFNKDEASGKLQMACFMEIVYNYLDYSLCILNQPSISDFLKIDKINSWKTFDSS